ncbi:MAG: spore coat associated protein CotJA [Ruminococcus sp.]|nr:spore coat associated protein CotJA [Ruminococcus sp.]
MEMKLNIGNGNNDSDNTSRFPSKTPLAMAYVPYQQWGETYGDDEALGRGTLFPELDLPFSGGGDSR